MKNLDENKFERAKKRVDEIKGFYTHLLVYIVINIALILLQLGFFNGFSNYNYSGWALFSTPFFWGIGLFFHGLYVFQHKFKFFKKWEERKIKEYMEKDEKEFKNTTKWD
ncbi:MAG: 2TM domain-containing protein [Flavobacteriaceae bacterium]|nr:2TM domain-containing protein [Flavobacteriaceae bacterium]